MTDVPKDQALIVAELVKQEVAKALSSVPVDDTRHTINQFMGMIASAQANGEEYIETTDEVIAHFNKRGLNGAKYFIYAGIKVYPKGQAEAIIAEESVSSQEKLHGRDGGVVEMHG